MSDPYPTARKSWDVERLETLRLMLEKYLLPMLESEARRELFRLSKEAILEEVAANYKRMIQFSPFRAENINIAEMLKSVPHHPGILNCACINISQNPREHLYMAMVDRDGIVRSHDILPSRIRNRNQRRERIKNFLKACRAELVVVNASGGDQSKSLAYQIKEHIARDITREVVSESIERGDDEDVEDYTPHVIILQDDIARIFGQSRRAKAMFPDFEPGIASAVCLARFTQDPLAEYANMWSTADTVGNFGFETLFLDIHPLKVREIKCHLA